MTKHRKHIALRKRNASCTPARSSGHDDSGVAVDSVTPVEHSVDATGQISGDISTSSSSTLGRLIRFAFANIGRRPERFVLSILGIALAIMAVTVVQTISASYANVGASVVTEAIDGASLWIVPAAGVAYDPKTQAIVAYGAAPQVSVPAGWQATDVIAGSWPSPEGPIALYGKEDVPAGTATVGRAGAKVLKVSDGGTVNLGGKTLTVTIVGTSRILTVPTDLARATVGNLGWWTVDEPADMSGRKDLGVVLSDSVHLPSTTNPSTQPSADGGGLVYDTVGGSATVTFEQQFSALFSGKVTRSTLGLVSTVGLILGFVIAVTSFLASVQERRREFGIMSSIGLADEVLYFFLVESVIVFLFAYLLGVLLAGAAVALVIPTIATAAAWAQASGTVAAYLPAMAIVGALIPVHRLLQQRPVALLSETP